MSITRTATRAFTPEDIDTCARLTGDLGSHHMIGFGDRRMTQGVLTLSAVPLLAGPGVHMRELSFAFLAPVYAGDTVTATVRLTESEDPLLATCEVSVVKDDGTTVLTGTGIAELSRAPAGELATETVTGGG
ncbi:hotdog domain-containing protein [Microtetraspora malaysiensis]|uniref:hotdog domain-containing protein n=1 Tax=Microtetraspora malaysiensis TaxID=161358 RepID=UPI0008355BDD|nr:hotdog domain-containing protein [Microtetraspora malaysiensis]